MKNQFLSFTGMGVQGCSTNNPEITPLSPRNHPLITPFRRVITMVMLLLTFAIGNVWAADYTLLASTATKNDAADPKSHDWTFSTQTFALSPQHGGTGQTGYSDYIKFSKNKTYTIALPDGFVLTNINIKGYTNSNGATNGEITKVNGVNQSSKTFPAKDDSNLASKTQITNGYDFAISQTGGNVTFTTANTSQLCVLITITGTPASSGPVDPTITFNNGAYTLGGAALDLSSLFTSNSAGAVTYSVKTDGGTSASISGSDFSATAAGTCVVTASQAEETGKYNAKSVDANIVVSPAETPACPSGLTISGTAAYTAGQTISLEAALEAGNGEITYNWYKGADLAAAKAAGSIGTGTSFSKASCTTSDAGNYFCVATKDACSDAESTAYAVTVAAAIDPWIIKVALSGDIADATKTMSGSIGGDAAYSGLQNSEAPYKIGGNSAYLNLTLSTGYFQPGDSVVLDLSKTGQIFWGATNNDADHLLGTTTSKSGIHYYILPASFPANTNTIHVGRTSSTYNGTVSYMAVYRIPICPSGLTISGEKDYVPGDKIELTASLAKGNGAITYQWYKGGTAEGDKLTGKTNAKLEIADCVAGDAGDYYCIASKEDCSDAVNAAAYTITVNDFVAVTGITISPASPTVAAKSKITLTAEVAPAEATNKVLAWSVKSGSEAYASVNATTGEVTGKAEGNAVIVATATDGSGVFAEKTVVVTPFVCPTKGEIASVVYDLAKKPGSEQTIPGNSRINMTTYATVTNAVAYLGNTGGSGNAKVTTSKFKLGGSQAYAKMELDCALKEGDTIRLDNSTTIKLSLDTAKTSAITVSLASGKHDYIVPAEGDNLSTIFVWQNGSNVEFSYVKVIRPAKYDVTFNMHGHGAQVEPQNIVSGGKVEEPATTDITGYAFGGWYKTYVADPESYSDAWNFAADVVNANIELHAKWTALPKMILNRGAATTGDDVVSYPTVGSAVAVPACPAGFEKTGYIFAGWVYSPSVTVEAGSFIMPNENLTLTAQWIDATSVARIGSTYYSTFAEALAHAADGEIVLLQDINVDAQVEIADGVTATIDLAGHKIEYTGSTTLSSGVILVHNGGSLTINDSSDPDAGSVVAGEKAYAALMLTKAGDDAANPATLTINGGLFTGYYYAISGNGSRPNTNITINGGTFTATANKDNLAIYHPQDGTLTINDGSFTGYLSAIEMRARTLEINGGSFTATAPTFSCNAAGSGTTTQGAAIAIAQHTTKKDIEVTINGGTFNGVKALNESNPQANDPAPQVDLAITAGTFTGEVTTVDVDKFISGGSFSEPVAEANCATGYVPETKANGKYGVIVPAQSIDFMAIIEAEGTGDEGKAELDAQLSSKHYDIDGTLNDDRLEAGGFKVKKTGLTISFSVEKEKVVEITTGHISGASIKVDDAAAVAMEGDKKHTYYSDDAQAFLITMTAADNKYNIFKSISIRAPYEVSFDVNGGDGSIAPRSATPSVTLPDATNGTQNFAGWYTDADVFVGMNGDSYTPTEDITLVAHWEALSTINTLSDLQVDGVTVDGFDADVHTYYIELPYGTDVSNLPKITTATPTNANATVNIYPAAGPEWTDDFGGCYRQQANVTPQDSNAAIGYNDIRITIAPKDMLCIIKANVGNNTIAIDESASYYTGTAYNQNVKSESSVYEGQTGWKMNTKGGYVGIKLDDEYSFQEGDVVEAFITTVAGDGTNKKLYVFSNHNTASLEPMAISVADQHQGANTAVLPENPGKEVYLCRGDDKKEYVNQNPFVAYVAVYRPVPNPLVETITFNGAVATVDNTASPKTITVEVPASTTLATMPVVATFYSNDPSQTSGAVTGGTWAEGTNEYIVTDKDNDQTVYTVTINKAVPSSDATLSTLSYGTPATAIALADGVYEYDVLLPYGTSDVPALAATAHHAGAMIESIDNATAFVDRKATSTVTVKAEDNTTTQVYTVNFTVDRYETTVLWDGSTMDELSDITALNIATADISVEGKTASFEGKNYTKALNFGGNTKNTRYFGIEIPAGKVAKVSVVYRSRGNSARSIIIGTAIASAIDESAIVYATKENDTELLYKLTADIFAAGTIYINTTNGFQVFEIDVQLADGYARSAMLGAGVYGTVCVPYNVAVEDIQGVTVYELMGRESQYGKLAFDEIVSGELEAGVPYVFQAHRNHMVLLYGEDNVADPVDKGNGMYGTFSDMVLTELNDVYYFAQKALWGCADLTSLNVPANRAYVKLSEVGSVASSVPAPGRRRISMAVNGEQVATGIENTGFESEAPRKVLINGEFYIIRGEKMYDAKGQLVK